MKDKYRVTYTASAESGAAYKQYKSIALSLEEARWYAAGMDVGRIWKGCIKNIEVVDITQMEGEEDGK